MSNTFFFRRRTKILKYVNIQEIWRKRNILYVAIFCCFVGFYLPSFTITYITVHQNYCLSQFIYFGFTLIIGQFGASLRIITVEGGVNLKNKPAAGKFETEKENANIRNQILKM